MNYAVHNHINCFIINSNGVKKMVYEKFHLDKALSGGMIEMVWGAFHTTRGFVHKSRNHSDMLIFEEAETGRVKYFKLADLVEKARMVPVKFDHWDMFSNDFVSIEKLADSFWRFYTKEGDEYNFRTEHFCNGFFPSCKAGTVINRTGVDNAKA